MQSYDHSSITEYLSHADWRINANANQDFSLGGLILNTSGKAIANYWLDQVFSPEAGQAHRDGDIHIHDLDMLAAPTHRRGIRGRPQHSLLRPAEAFKLRLRPGGEFPRYSAKRVGRGASL